MKLTEKQKRFIDYYVETGNQSEAARKAGYKQPYTQGAQNFEKLRKFIEEKIAVRDAERIANRDEILKYLTSIVRGEQQEQTLKGVGEGRQVISDIDVSAKDRIKAAELLGKRYAMWTEKQDIDVKGAVTFVDDIGDGDET